jgi:hypothetical protein
MVKVISQLFSIQDGKIRTLGLIIGRDVGDGTGWNIFTIT